MTMSNVHVYCKNIFTMHPKYNDAFLVTQINHFYTPKSIKDISF